MTKITITLELEDASDLREYLLELIENDELQYEQEELGG